MRLAVISILALAPCLYGHDVITTKITWSKEIVRIVNARCIACHTGDISFTDYQQARPWAKAIKEEVLERRMPPWGAVKGFGEFKNDVSLSQEEITLIAEWVEGGAPEGDPSLLPAKPVIHPSALSARHGVTIHGNLTLKAPMALEAIRPLTPSASAQITARRPDGAIEPLLWLYNYKPDWKQTFVYRGPVQLPKGTVIEMTSPLDVELFTAAPKQAR
ncbi:MAG: cytochrome c [Bryobacteraceae bacterium]